MVDGFKLWQAGTTIKACFFASENDVRKRFVEIAQDWLVHANLKIDFGNGPSYRDCSPQLASQIRISFHLSGNWSYVGSDSIRVDLGSPSLNIQSGNSSGQSVSDQSTFREVVLHELGHALGLQHEHQSPRSNCDAEFNWDVIYTTYAQRYQWDRKKVDVNLRALVRSPRLKTTEYDRNSIMHYYFPDWMFYKGESSSCYVGHNKTLSELDKKSVNFAYPSDPRKQIELVKSREEQARGILSDLKVPDEQIKVVNNRINDAVQTVAPGMTISVVQGGNVSGVGPCATVATGIQVGSGASVSIGSSGCNQPR